jgi:hypothetical protein
MTANAHKPFALLLAAAALLTLPISSVAGEESKTITFSKDRRADLSGQMSVVS